MRLLFGLACLALPLLVFAALGRRRRARYRALAGRLRGRHVDGGPFVPGAIRGDGFEVEASAPRNRYSTRVRVGSPTPPGVWLLQPGFFGDRLDWSRTAVLGTERQRVFLWEAHLPRYVEPNAAQRAALLAWLGSDAPRPELATAWTAAGIRDVLLDDGSLTTRLPGLVQDVDRLERVLDALRTLRPRSAVSQGHARFGRRPRR